MHGTTIDHCIACTAAAQIQVDVGTPMTLFEHLRSRMKDHIEAHAADFSGAISVTCCDTPTPLKICISIWWELSFNGEGLR